MPQHPNQNRPSLILYSLLTCPRCRRVKEFLEQHAVPFKLYLVDLLIGEERSKVLAEIKSRNPAVTFPTLVVKDVEDRVVVGDRLKDIEQVLRDLKWIQDK
ncbi:MAG: glutaredoxin family protein [Desulfosoma sp.]